jgi:hypothetical protein
VNRWREGPFDLPYDDIEDAAHRAIERECGIM